MIFPLPTVTVNYMAIDREQSATAADDLTIDQLAATSGVPSRTIRFYQAKGVLPPPRKRGRVALYGPAHIERLQLISELQDRGLRLRAIREVLSRPETSNETIREWLGVSEQVGDFMADTPQLMSERELRELLGDPKPGVITTLLKNGSITREGDGLRGPHFVVRSPALLRVAVALGNAGISLEVALGLGEILEKRLAKAAEEIVDYAIEHIGQGFGRSSDPKDVADAIEALWPNATEEALRLIFAREVTHAAAEHRQHAMETVAKRSAKDRG